MPGYAHPVAYAVARKQYGPDEAKRLMTRRYGIAGTGAGTADRGPAQDWRVRIGRRLAALAAASPAIPPWS
jgi:hypothetical protein